MKHLALATFVVNLCVVAAAAQDTTPVYVMSEVCAPERMSRRVYPQRALERGLSGEATIDCTLSESHEPVSCIVVAESAPGWGWGAAAVQASCRAEAQSWRQARGSNAENYTDDAGIAHARRTIRFRIPSGQQP